MTSIEQQILVITAERPSILVVFRTHAITREGAEKKLLRAMRKTMVTIAPRHAYLLPLDGRQTVAALNFSAEHLELDESNLAHSLFAHPYELISVSPDHGYIQALATYSMNANRRGTNAVIPTSRTHPRTRLLIWDTFRLIEGRMKWPVSDGLTVLLSSMFATQGTTIGERITDLNDGPDSQSLVIRPVGGASVELSKVQLRAVVRVYTPE